MAFEPDIAERVKTEGATVVAVTLAVNEALQQVARRIAAGELPPITPHAFFVSAARATVIATENPPRTLALPLALLCHTEEQAHILIAEAFEAKRKAEAAAREAGITRSEEPLG